jgi:hypothetical protein
VYWTILIDGQPTAFRASAIEELLPTFNRLKQKHPATELKWFERGRLWESRDEARRLLRAGYTVWSGGRLAPPRRPRSQENGAPDRRGEDRGSAWRPGGEHRDPRERFRLAKKDKWKRFKLKIRERRARTDRGHGNQGGPADHRAGGDRSGHRATTRQPGHTGTGTRRRAPGRKPPKPRGRR